MSRRTINSEICSERLKELRKASRMTQEQLSESVGISINSIKNYESGHRRTPDQKNLELLARFFNVDSAWIIGESDYKTIYDKWNKESDVEKLSLESSGYHFLTLKGIEYPDFGEFENPEEVENDYFKALAKASKKFIKTLKERA